MCDQDQFEKDRQEFEARGLVTRRQFGVLLGAGMAMMLPRVVNAVAVTDAAVTETTQMTDAKAFIGWLDQQSSVAKNRKIGTQGYCMGGPIAFRTAAAVP